jgi:hypothetical protein
MEAHRGPRVSIIPRANVTLVGPRGSVRGRVERSSLIHPGKATGYVPLILVRSIRTCEWRISRELFMPSPDIGMPFVRHGLRDVTETVLITEREL